MATWGYKLYEDDSFCEVVEAFKSKVMTGLSANQALLQVKTEYEGDINDNIVQLAIAESLWRLNAITVDVLDRINCIIESGADKVYWKSLGADEVFISHRILELNRFLERIRRSPTPYEMWNIDEPQNELSKGTCFWYKNKGNIYGAIVLEIQELYYLIAITDKLTSIPLNTTDVLSSTIYTIAWFSDVSLLNFKRIHVIGMERISISYLNRYGLQIKPNQSVSLSNCGQSFTWAHTFRTISFPGRLLGDFVK